MITTVGLYLSLFLSVALLSWGFLANGFLYPALGLAAFGIAWALGQLKWAWIGSLGLAVITLAAVLGIFYNLPISLMAGGALFALTAWDLEEFHLRLKKASKEDDVNGIIRGHFVRLGMVLASGGGIILLAWFMRVRFNFEVAALLVLAGVWGISLLVRRLQRDG